MLLLFLRHILYTVYCYVIVLFLGKTFGAVFFMINSTKQQKKNYADIREQVTNKCNVPNVFNAFPLKIQRNLYQSDMRTVFHYFKSQQRVVFAHGYFLSVLLLLRLLVLSLQPQLYKEHLRTGRWTTNKQYDSSWIEHKNVDTTLVFFRFYVSPSSFVSLLDIQVFIFLNYLCTILRLYSGRITLLLRVTTQRRLLLYELPEC